MPNKCEWKDGKFEGCEPMEYRMKNHGWVFTVLAKRLTMYYNDNGFWFCPFCGADIRKPEEKPKIYLTINGEKFDIDFDSTAEEIAEIITTKTEMLAVVTKQEAEGAK